MSAQRFRLAPEAAAPPVDLGGELARLRRLLGQAGERLRQAHSDDPLAAHRGLVISDAAFARIVDEPRPLPASAPAPEPRWAPLTGLAQRLGLDAFATDLVLLLLAAEVAPELGAAMAYVQDDAARPWPTLALAGRLFATPPESVRRALLPDAPLLRLRVVAVEEPAPGLMPERPLRLEAGVLGWLLDHYAPDPLIAAALVELPPPLLDAPLGALAERLAARLAEPEALLRVALAGLPRSGRRAVATAMAARLGLRLVTLDLETLAAGGEPAGAIVATLGRDAALLDLAYLVEAPAGDGAPPGTMALWRLLQRRLEALLVTLQPPGAPVATGTVMAELEDPGLVRRLGLWQAALPEGHGVAEAPLAELAGAIELGPTEIALVARGAAATAPDLTAEALRHVARRHAAAAMGGLAERLTPAAGWGDLVLPDDTMALLREIAAAARGRVRVMGAWGMAQGSRGRGLAVLFTGLSGTGKTTAAEVLAQELDLDLWRIDLASTVSKWSGETEKNLKKIFDAADGGSAVLFFDEADALFGKRAEVKDARDRFANIEVDDLLQRIERHRGIAILATNRKGDLDPAFMRRLRYVVPFPLPDAPARRRIWAGSFPAATPTAALDLDLLAGMDLAGGSIRNIALNAASLAAAEGVPVSMAHIGHAARREHQKLEKLPVGIAVRAPGS
ncbi:MAG: ATP-binding protein [Geminicoccaceae bacterium]